MRARFIRGEDPKAAMEIGDKYLRIRDRMEMGARIICRDYDLDIKTIKTELKEDGISVEFPGRQPNLVHPYKYWMYYDKERDHYWVGYSLLKNDEIGDQKPCNDLEKAMLETRIFLNKFNWTAKGAVHESMNFERGVDPKTSMRIGYYYARSQEFMDFIKEEMSWNDPVIEMTDDGNFTYHCLPGNSVIRELREAVEKFGWGNVIKVNKDPDDWASRHHDDGATRHYYVLKFKKDKKLKESLNFERGLDPKKSMKIGLYQWQNIDYENILTCKENFVLYNSDLNATEKEINANKKFSKNFLKGQQLIIKSVEWFTSTIVSDGIEEKIPKLQIAYWVIDANGRNMDSGIMKGTIEKFTKFFNLTDNKSLEESLNFERGSAPMDSMEIGRVNERKMKTAYNQIKEAIEKMAVEWWGPEILTQEDNTYFRIREKVTEDFMEIGIEHVPDKWSYFYYLVYVLNPDEGEGETHWAAGYNFKKVGGWPAGPNAMTEDHDEIPYDTLEDAINKMKYWYKNL